jgi:hypothetical protein
MVAELAAEQIGNWAATPMANNQANVRILLHAFMDLLLFVF